MKRAHDGEHSSSTSPRPAKRRLVSPTPTPATLPLPARTAAPPPAPPFQQPVQLLSFSYTSQPDPADSTQRVRTLEWNDASLRYYVPPPEGADLAHGYARWVRRPEERPRLDGLLAACMRQECAGARRAAGVVTWRGVVTKILTAPYEARDGWSVNVMRVGGVLYLEEHLTEAQLREKSDLEEHHRLMSYYGYAFESYCTADAPREPGGKQGWGGDVDTNVQWCSVVKTKLGNTRMLIGGEVDCVKGRYTGQPDTFVELKTSMALRPRNQNDAAKFEKKLLKFHIQSFLLGVPEIIVGFRTREGRLQTVQSFKTLDLPRLVRGKRDAWNPAVCLAWGARVFDFLRETVERNQDEAGGDAEESAVWRATFIPGERITMYRLDAEAVEDVRGGEERVGFLPQWYWDEVRGGGEGGDTVNSRMQQEKVGHVKEEAPSDGRGSKVGEKAMPQVQGWQI